MTPESGSTTPASTPEPKRAYSGRGDIEKSLLDDIQTARDVLAAANHPDYNAAIVTRVKPATLTRLDGNLKTAADDPDQNLCKDVFKTKKAAAVATQSESDLYAALMPALRIIQKAAGTTHKKDKARRAAYLIGKKDFGDNRATLEADASAIIALAGQSPAGGPHHRPGGARRLEAGQQGSARRAGQLRPRRPVPARHRRNDQRRSPHDSGRRRHSPSRETGLERAHAPRLSASSQPADEGLNPLFDRLPSGTLVWIAEA